MRLVNAPIAQRLIDNDLVWPGKQPLPKTVLDSKEAPPNTSDVTFNLHSIPLPSITAPTMNILEKEIDRQIIETIRQHELLMTFPTGNYVTACQVAKSRLAARKYYGPYLLIIGHPSPTNVFELEGFHCPPLTSPLLTSNQAILVQTTPDVIRLIVVQEPQPCEKGYQCCINVQLRSDPANVLAIMARL